MHPHDTPHITRQIPPARRDCQIFTRIQAVRVDHEISVILVYARRLAAVLVAEELWDGAALDRVDGTEREPRRVGWNDERVGLRGEVGCSKGMKVSG